MALFQTVQDCQELQFSEVKVASVRQNGQLTSVKIQFTVTNQEAIFEGSFSWPASDLSRLETGSVVRLDWYTSTSRCVPATLKHIRPYCIC